ncbi:MAG: tRNA (adenosine(37)-N6)-threonylcarbamoyltransferase complex transferase subunit TsaD [Saprospiraceae bacterium]|nr:tRNA (adenosine(37)-N6)-threonylcarbamoyltransferase complex transferase subunit TsaD [Candidatus Opimibacter iunctus]
MIDGNSYLLAIESSCDDTSAAVMCNGVILSNVIASQAIHAQYGGIVPEVASRMHQENIAIVVDAALKKAGVQVSQLNGIACTAGPGLMGSLTVGLSFAKAMALSLGIPFISVNHMRAHVLSHFIDAPKPQFPFFNLTVSGGHTQIVLVRSYSDMEVLGQTLDDAAGEAFDKSGKILGLPYPAGPIIDKHARQGKPIYPFPIPHIEGLDFSFSGVKTAILYFIRDEVRKDPDFISKHINDICASIQHTIVEILVRKLTFAAQQYGIKEIGIAGGVAANSGLRDKLTEVGRVNDWNLYFPAMQYCTDNAGMIAMAGWFEFLEGIESPLDTKPFIRGMQ